MENEINELEDKYKRIYADFENYKRRVDKERNEIILSTKIEMLSSILEIDNDLSYALKSIKDEHCKEGLNLMSKKIESFLKKHNIESIQCDEYDKDVHEVVNVIDGGRKIIDIVSKGYTIGDKIFKYPKVILGNEL